MQRISRTLSICFLLSMSSAGLGCDANLGNDGGDETGNDSNGDGGGDGDGFSPCSSSNPCSDGQFCFNGLCAIGCLSDGDCASEQYCATESDMLCHAKEVPTCTSADQCASSQVCINGYCSAMPEDTSCNLEDYINDGCDSTSVCLEDPKVEGKGLCYEMPACSVDGTCPVGLQGAVCNDGEFPSKDAICLVGLCDSVDNCPAEWACVRFNNSALGACGNRGFGSPCVTAADCDSGNCFEIPLAGGGFCS